MKSFFSFCLFILVYLPATADKSTVTDRHLEIAQGQLKALGLNAEEIQLKKSDLDIFATCMSSTWDEFEPEHLIVSFVMKKAMVLKNISLKKGAQITLCNGKFRDIFGNLSAAVQGYPCGEHVVFDKSEKLCECTLQKLTTIAGVKVPEGAGLLLRDSKPYAIFVPGTNTLRLEKGYHQFVSNKLQFQKKWETVLTCDEEIYNK